LTNAHPKDAKAFAMKADFLLRLPVMGL